ncbi:MAG TPA: YraN family protein, partial [Burkholderiaceae bacterium]
MDFLGKRKRSATTKQVGDAAEEQALQQLARAGLCLIERNYRTPGRGGGEVDLIM